MDLNIIIVSLERALDRLQNMKTQLEKLSITNAYFYPAFDGKQITNETFNINIDIHSGYVYRQGIKLLNSDIGCLLSHAGALTVAKTLNWEYAIILEDDMTLCEDFIKRIKYLFKILPKDWEHVYLSGMPHFKPFDKIRADNVNKNFLNIQPSIWTSCTYAYMVKKEAYLKIIKRLSSMETTVDDLINKCIFEDKKIISYTYFPFVAKATKNICSTLYNEKDYIDDNNLSVQFFKNNIL
jgi:GR25 family glycosyltransferase involved in LPS biosynthesis